MVTAQICSGLKDSVSQYFCSDKITILLINRKRVNLKNPNSGSALDFMVVSLCVKLLPKPSFIPMNPSIVLQSEKVQ